MIVKELVNPSGIIVVGGSNDLSKPGGTVLRNLINGGYKGRIHVLNPREKTVQGIESFGKAELLPEADCAIFAVPSSAVVDTAEILASEKKTKAFIVFSAGFSETGPDGKALEQRLVNIVNRVSGTLIGPNCTGVLFPGFMGAFAGPIPELVPQGIDLAAASGAVAVFFMERAIPMGITFSSVAAVGNSPQCGVEDFLRYWDETYSESGSQVKILYMEQIRRPELLLKHARSLIRKGCRIAAVKSGSTEAGSRAAMSHTGALAGTDTAVDALFRKCGITRCFGREELVYTAGVMLHRKPAGRSFAVVTHAGGPGVMAADALSAGGLSVPPIEGESPERLRSELFAGSSTGNPIDFIGTGTAEQLGTILDFIDKEAPQIDASLVIFGTPGLFDVKHVYTLLDEKMKNSLKPVFPVLPSTMLAADAVNHFTGLGRIFFPDEVLLAKSLAAVLNTPLPFEENIKNSADTTKIRDIISSAQSGLLPPDLTLSLLTAAGIPCVKEFSVFSRNEVLQRAVKLNFPIVMKVIGPLHKSDSGGVRLSISSPDEASAVYDELMNKSGAEGVLMQEMVSGIELYAGGRFEPGLGHVILCGLGGILVEVLKDISAGTAPVGRDEALDMIRRLKGYEIIKGARGRRGVNEVKFAEIIAALSELLSAAPEIDEIDINPLMADGDDIVSVDCRIIISHPSSS